MLVVMGGDDVSQQINYVPLALLHVDSLLIDNLWVLKSRPSATAELCRLFRDRNKAKRLTVVASEFSLEEWHTKNRNLAKLPENGGSLQCSSVNKMRISSEVLNE